MDISGWSRQETMTKFILVVIAAMTSIYSVSGTTRPPKLDLTTFRQQNLLCHTQYREKHGVQPLQYSAKLNKDAQAHAKLLASADSFSVQANFSLPYGHCLFQTRDDKVDAYVACDTWYLESRDYNYEKNQPNNYNDVGHFTQMVSRVSCYMGAGMATSKSGATFIVVLYYPKGNVKNEYRRNVLRPGTNRHKTSRTDAMMGKVVCEDQSRDDYLKQNLECHNEVRRRHGVGLLTYTDELNERALEKAEWLADRGTGLRNEGDEDLKDFRMISYSGYMDGYNYCQHYYSLGQQTEFFLFYNMDKNGSMDKNIIGFPQMIWNSTQTMGFGMARSKNGNIYTVVAYDPPGNIKGLFRSNVFPQTAEDTEWVSPDPDSWERF